ncbi:MAG TPA: SET domain-containing protein-lysine N-methyltransferase [Candidatus Angelobacter sp.]|nr:SET domain-containing protein-lysine N-methyltransferase [Candidatus Angelobacter sp.]
MENSQDKVIVSETDLVTFKSSSIHGTGGFARIDIASETPIIEYVGEKISKQESLARCEQHNEYIFALDDEHDLDGNVSWNPARFLNHSCEPNCEARWEDGRIWIIAIRDVRAGEELTFNYNYDLDEYHEYPCRCGAPGCVGFIVAEEFFEEVRRRHRGALRKNTD